MTKSRGIRGTEKQINVRILLALHKLEEATTRQIATAIGNKTIASTLVELKALQASHRIRIVSWTRPANVKWSPVYAIKTHYNQLDVKRPENGGQARMRQWRARQSMLRKLNGTFGSTNTGKQYDIRISTNNSGCSEMETSDGTMRET